MRAAYGTTGRLELGLQGNIAGRLSRRLLWRAAGKFGCHSGTALQRGAQEHRPSPCFSSRCLWVPGSVAALRHRNDGEPGLFQRTTLAVSTAPTMSKAATAGVSEACAMPDAAAEIMREAATHAMSEAVAEIAVRTRIIRSVAPIVG